MLLEWGATSHSKHAPVSFREAWASSMSQHKLRDWLFNNAAPTFAELMHCQANAPILHSLNMKSDPNSGDWLNSDTDYYYKPYSDLSCNCYFLPCGTVLGLGFTHNDVDILAPALARIDPAFTDGRLCVRRTVLSTCEGRLFVILFNWLASGALIIRFVPISVRSPLFEQRPNEVSMSSDQLEQASCNAFAHVFTFALVPDDASVLAACARELSKDFLTGNFDKLGISERCYRVSQYDTAYQSPCVFCLSRGAPACACPTPLRRRAACNVGATPELSACRASSASVVCDHYLRIVAANRNCGSYVYNVSMGSKIGHKSGIVIGSGILPFNHTITVNLRTHKVLQRHLDEMGQSSISPYPLLSDASTSSQEQQTRKQSARLSIKRDGQKARGDRSDHTSNSWQGCSRKRTRSKAALSSTQLNVHESESVGTIQAQSNALGGSAETNRQQWQDVSALKVPCREAAEMQSSGHRDEQAHEAKEVKMYKCPICGIEIRNKRSNLTRHITNKHSSKRRFACHASGCDRKFQTRLNLTRHQHTTHSRSETKRLDGENSTQSGYDELINE